MYQHRTELQEIHSPQDRYEGLWKIPGSKHDLIYNYTYHVKVYINFWFVQKNTMSQKESISEKS